MLRFAIVIAGLLWASLLLISWSGPYDQPRETVQVGTTLPLSRN